MLLAPLLLAAFAGLAQAADTGLEAALRGAEQVWLCPLHPETHRAEPGSCEVCRRPLEQKAVTWLWACPMHPDLTAAREGVCAVCGMPRSATTVEAVWRCSDEEPDAPPHTEPGSCRDGSPRKPELRALAHGDHNPRHGGVFFMAPDRFHHLEGALRDGRFRVYLYDNFTQPLEPAGFAARVGETRLTAVAGALEAPAAGPLPLELVVHVDFGAGGQRFDFVFSDESLPPALPELVIPDSPAAIRAELALRDQRLRELVRLGAWTQLYLPALEARQLALALQLAAPDTDELAVKRLVRAAWLLDLHGDIADRPGVERAYALFREGFAALGVPR